MERELDAERGSSELHVVVGAGPIGSGIARSLAERGHRVKIVTRSGSGPDEAGIERVAADASDASALASIATGASAIYNCANPPYHRWPELWPPMAAAMLGAAEKSGAVLVTISNLYGYGPARNPAGYNAPHPMTEQSPLAATGKKGKVRAQMWREAFEAHQAGRAKVVELRASDYVGPGANAVLGDRVVPRVLKGQAVTLLGRTDRPRTWSYTGDVVKMAVLVSHDERAWGKVWHVPSGEPRTQQQAVDDIARVAGVKPVPVRTAPGAVMYAMGMFSPLMRELRETRYQFSEDFIMDSSAAELAFGLEATPWDSVLAELISSFKKQP